VRSGKSKEHTRSIWGGRNTLDLLIFVLFCLFRGPQYVVQAGLDLLASKDPPALASQVAGTTGAHHPTWLVSINFKPIIMQESVKEKNQRDLGYTCDIWC
jgi:hypothetical protein